MNQTPTNETENTTRCVILPLDCSRADLIDLISRSFTDDVFDNSRFYEYMKAATNQPAISSTPPEGLRYKAELGTFPALATLRVEYADPLTGTKFVGQEPEASAESRMATQPFQTHPGLTIFHSRVRTYYISTVQWYFEQNLSADLQSEIATVLLSPDPPPRTLDADIGQYKRTSPSRIRDRYTDRIRIDDTHIHLPTKYASQRILIPPQHASHVPELYTELPPIEVSQGKVSIPKQVFRIKLAEYAWNAWARLVNVAFHALSAREIHTLVDRTPWVAKIFRGRFKRNNRVFTPYYGVKGVSNPMREWDSQQNPDFSSRPAKLEDKRLTTLVDWLRASPVHQFGDKIPLSEIVDSLRMFFPAPHRPGNDLSNVETLKKAITNASNSKISLSETSDGTKVVTMAEPRYTPIHPRDTGKPWQQYLALLETQLRHELKLKPAEGTRPSSRRTHIDPVRSQNSCSQEKLYEYSLRSAPSPTVPMPMHRRTVGEVEPLVDPDSIPRLTRDEIVFLTRIGLAMERRLEDFSLTRSMRPLRFATDGSSLNIDLRKLVEDGWLEIHDEGRLVLYSLPPDKRSELRIPNVSHDGYGELTTAERSLHRRGVDMTAASLAARREVTRVIRYFDLWRLKNTRFEDRLREADLLDARIDLIAFEGTDPVHAASVETASHSAAKSRRSLDKLAAMSNGLVTTLVTPNSDHLWTIMRLLQHPDYLEFETFPQSNPENWDRSNWEEKIGNAGYARQFFQHLETYRSLENTELSENDYRQRKILGNV